MTLNNLDYQLFKIINDLAGKLMIFNPLMRILAADAEYLFYIIIVIYWFTRVRQNRKMVIESLLSACIALGISGIIAHFYYRDRPFITHTVYQLIKHPANASFPSDHATGAFVIATAIWLFRKKDGKIWLLLALCIALSRIWTGVHYPSDVIAGAFIGSVSAFIVHRLFAKSLYASRLLEHIIHFYELLEKKLWKEKKYDKLPINKHSG
jgi:undecaprenyl-diphosphatase